MITLELSYTICTGGHSYSVIFTEKALFCWRVERQIMWAAASIGLDGYEHGHLNKKNEMPNGK